MCCSPWGCKESDSPEQLNWTEITSLVQRCLHWTCWVRGKMPQREWSQIISFPKGELSTLINCTLELASGFPGGSLLSRRQGSIPGSGRSPGEGNGNPLQYSCLGNPMREEPGGLQSMVLQSVGHDLATKQQSWSQSNLQVSSWSIDKKLLQMFDE